MKNIITLPGWGFDATCFSKLWTNSTCLTSEDFFREGTTNPLKVLENATKDFGDSPYMVVGWSLGGLLALDYFSTHEDSRANLILLSPTSYFKFMNEENFDELSDLQSNLTLNREKALRGFYLKLAGALNKGRTELFDIINKYKSDSEELSTHSLVSALEYLKVKELSNTLFKIKNPTLIVHGERDNLIPLSHSELIHNSMSNSSLKVLRNACHLLPCENKNEILELIKENVLFSS